MLPSRAFFTLRPTDVACVDLSMPWKLCGLANSANLVAGRNIIGRDQASQSELSVPMGETKLQLGITAKSVSRRHAVLTQAAAGSLRLETVSKTVPTCVVRGSHVHVLFNNQPYMEMQAGDLIVPNGNTLLRDLLPEAVNPSQGYSAPEVAAARPIQVTEANLVKITAGRAAFELLPMPPQAGAGESGDSSRIRAATAQPAAAAAAAATQKRRLPDDTMKRKHSSEGSSSNTPGVISPDTKRPALAVTARGGAMPGEAASNSNRQQVLDEFVEKCGARVPWPTPKDGDKISYERAAAAQQEGNARLEKELKRLGTLADDQLSHLRAALARSEERLAAQSDNGAHIAGMAMVIVSGGEDISAGRTVDELRLNIGRQQAACAALAEDGNHMRDRAETRLNDFRTWLSDMLQSEAQSEMLLAAAIQQRLDPPFQLLMHSFSKEHIEAEEQDEDGSGHSAECQIGDLQRQLAEECFGPDDGGVVCDRCEDEVSSAELDGRRCTNCSKGRYQKGEGSQCLDGNCQLCRRLKSKLAKAQQTGCDCWMASEQFGRDEGFHAQIKSIFAEITELQSNDTPAHLESTPLQLAALTSFLAISVSKLNEMMPEWRTAFDFGYEFEEEILGSLSEHWERIIFQLETCPRVFDGRPPSQGRISLHLKLDEWARTLNCSRLRVLSPAHADGNAAPTVLDQACTQP